MKRFNWTVRNLETGEEVGYSASFCPVDENHVRNSPSVKRWGGENHLKIVPKTFEKLDKLKG